MTRTITAQQWKKFAKDAFDSISCPSEISEPVIEGLVTTSLRGIDSHGIRLFPHYIQAVLIGRVNCSPQWNLKETSPTTVVLDADHTFGITAGQKAMHIAVEMAAKSGSGCVAVKNSSHFGAASIYTLTAAQKDMIGLSFSNTDALVLPFGGKKPWLGTNPISFAAPCEEEDPFCLDMATSSITWNKLLQHQQEEISLPQGWAADQDGDLCTNPKEAIALLPSGGYKGYGLALMVQILCSLLTGMPFGPDTPAMYPLNGKKRKLGQIFIAIDIKRFEELETFKRRMKEVLTFLRQSPPAKGFSKVQVAGDPEKAHYRKRIQEGIPLEEEECRKLRILMHRLQWDENKYSFLFGETHAQSSV